MKRKEAIKKLRQGIIQIENDLLPSTKEISKLLKKAFPNDKEEIIECKYYRSIRKDHREFIQTDIMANDFKSVKLSSITKPKNKLKQLEKGYSELCKDVCENNNKITNKQKELEDRIIDLERSVSFLNNNNIDSENPLQSPVKTFEPDFENLSGNLEEINKWYKDTHPKNMFIGFVIGEKEGKYIGYGLNYTGDWHTKEEFSIDNLDQLMEATPQEVEQALITEAKKRYPIGSNIDCFDERTTLLGDEFMYCSEENILYVTSGKYNIVFKNGEWAEIIQETPIKEELIDWSKPQLLISKANEGFIYFYDGKSTNKTFTVYVLNTSEVFLYKNNEKDIFAPFKGTLTINQE